MLRRLENAYLTFSGENRLSSNQRHDGWEFCGPYNQKPSLEKVNVVYEMKEECESQPKLRRVLGACVLLSQLDPALCSHYQALVSTT